MRGFINFVRPCSIRLITLALIIVFGAVNLSARPIPAINAAPQKCQIVDSPYVTIRVHEEGKLGLAVSNIGILGKSYIPRISTYNADTESQISSCEYPVGSGIEYLYGAYLWIGGIINNDTIATMAANGWDDYVEFWPRFYPEGSIKARDSGETGAVANREYIAVYHDTINYCNIESSLPLPPDYHKFLPVSLEIIQTSYSWSHHDFEDFVIIKYSIKNTADWDIHDAWIGFLVDADAGIASSSLSDDDDIAGFLDDENIAYIIDNDGDPRDSTAWSPDSSARAAIGLKILGCNRSIKNINFNWMVPDVLWGRGFAPQHLSAPYQPLTENAFFEMPGKYDDEECYFLLSHDERDFNQLWANIDFSGDSWLPPPDNSLDIADGADTRFLLSFGDFELPPEEKIEFYIALVMGDSVHVNPGDFINYFNPDFPEKYYIKLYFGDLVNLSLIHI